jgi:hypothetical protein
LETQIVGVCDKKESGQATACGAIPDSGTTLITAPKDQLGTLLDGICTAWPRCSSNHSKYVQAASDAAAAATKTYGSNPFKIDGNVTKTEMLKYILADCGTWMNKDTLSELPTLNFHLAGTEGKQQTVSLPGSMWIIEQKAAAASSASSGAATDSSAPQTTYSSLAEIGSGSAASRLEEAIGTMDGGDKAKLWALFRGADKICSPAFEAMDMPTSKNGPVWILGTPLFYQYQVGFGMKSTPPSLSFISTKQKPCNGNGVAAASSKSDITLRASLAESDQPSTPLQIQGPYRRPSFTPMDL